MIRRVMNNREEELPEGEKVEIKEEFYEMLNDNANLLMNGSI